MTTETILTHGQIRAAIDESGPDNYFGLSRAIEQAVLQSPEIQALRKDAGRYRYLKTGSTLPDVPGIHSHLNKALDLIRSYEIFCTSWVNWDDAIDAAIRSNKHER